uniref:cytochrome c oxidase subunit II n=1 Tax=Xyloredo nooi TaxID=2584333 RepID=UPI002028F212|nr:cytochrome c oxidase subunit II [Xyloredo nooi]UPX88995.1 cytochrome c oxidase subunit 2 [Xyloredo nooi]UPX89007.1 cytochrome c oxidase subunit 2 [Xyloredo nooi]
MVVESMKMGFIDPFTAECGNLVSYHDLTMVVAVGVMVLVLFFLAGFLFFRFFLKGYGCSNLTKHNKVEIFWTTSPGVLLCFLAYLSWVNLYVMEVGLGSDYHLKVVGRQWYWEYEYYIDSVLLDYVKGWSGGEFLFNFSEWLGVFVWPVSNFLAEGLEVGVRNTVSVAFDSYSWSYSDSVYNGKGSLMGVNMSFLPFSRKGSSSEVVFLPVERATEVSISTGDVIHSWGVPALGVKMDAVPGRTNHLCVEPLSVGFLGGNCYELCGYGHSVMPISIGVVSEGAFLDVLKLGLNSVGE